MTVHVHKLTGCKPVPLAHYLKALGILRLVSAQADPEARGCFRDESFVLCSRLDDKALVQLFLERYAPTPLVAPWNGGSGFYPKDNRDAIEAIRNSKSDRFATYREAIALATELVGSRTEAPKDEPKFALQRALRHRATGPLAEWLDAVFVFGSDGSPSYPALLGTGGNDGRLDFTNNFMQRLAELFDLTSADGAARTQTEHLIVAALWDKPIAGLSAFAIGQFLPGLVGGANSGHGFRGNPAINPWDFVLMLEGATALHPSATKQLDSQDLVQAGAPFAFRASVLGYASSADSEEDNARGEQWMPLWNQPASFAELSAMFAEGRSQVGRTAAQRPLDFARAVARLGVSRGIESFQRYGFIERNGQANLAVPLARWRVQIAAQQDLVDQAAQWVDRLRIMTRAETAPNGLKRAVRRCEEALLAVCAGSSNILWQRVLIEFGAAERALLRSPKFAAEKNLRPLPGLSPEWLEVAKDKTSEWRIAVAVASLHDVAEREENAERETSGQRRLSADWKAPLRRYALPLGDDKNHGQRTLDIGQSGLVLPPHIVLRGENIVDDLVAFALRRCIDAPAAARGTFGLTSAQGIVAPLVDLAAFIDGTLDERRIAHLVWPLLAIRWWDNRLAGREGLNEDRSRANTMTAFGLFRAAAWMAPASKKDLKYPLLDPAMLHLIAGGHVTRASAVATRRLRAVGKIPRVSVVSATPQNARRILAALSVPLSKQATEALENQVCRLTLDEKKKLAGGEANA